MVVRTILVFLLVITNSTLNAQINVQNFGVAQGLPQTQVKCIAEDSLSYLWIGTLGGGLTRFDGSTFTTYNMADGLPNNFILDLLVISPTKIWVATQKGVSFFDGIGFKNFDTANGSGLITLKIFSNKDSIFYVLNNGDVGLILNDSIQAKVTNSWYKILRVLKASSTLTFILRSEGTELKLVILDDGLIHTKNIGDQFTTLYSTFSFNGETVLSTDGGIFSTTNGNLVKISDINIPIYGYDRIHDQFIGNNNYELVHVDTQNDSITDLDPLKVRVDPTYMDSDGVIWIGSDRGLYKIHPYIFENKLVGPERDDPIMAIGFHENKLLLGTTYRGIKVYENNVLVDNYNFGSPNRNFINFLKRDFKKGLWLGTTGGLAYYTNGGFHWVHPEIITSAIQADFDADNNIVVSVEGKGLYKIPDSGEVQSYPETSSMVIWSIKYNQSKNFFALGTNVGLKKLSGNSIEHLSLPELANFEISVLDWYDPETLIIGTFGGGIFIYSFKAGKVISTLNEATGLQSNTIFFLFKDGPSIWAGTERGIDKIELEEKQFKIESINHYGAQEGLIGLETNLNSFYKTDSLLFFGTVDGLYTFKDDNQKRLPGQIHINDLKLFYKDNPIDAENIITNSNYAKREYTFAHTENHITFSFNKVDKTKPESIYYSYKLEGYDNIWSTPSQTKTSTYSQLSPGSYTFKVAATDKSGSFIYDQTTFRFQIIPAFYQTTQFKFVTTIFIIGAIAGSIYYYNRIKINRALYIQEIKDNEKTSLRKEIARDFHDELGNQVARMINYIGLLRIRGILENTIYVSLNEFSQNILTGAKDFVWTLDPTNDELGKVMIHLKDFGERMFSEKEIEFRFHGDISTQIIIPMGFSRQINLIFKEAMTNAFKHSQASKVTFKVQKNDCEIIMTLNDNGVGISQTVLENSQRGLSNIKARAQRIGGKVHIQSKSDGTLLEFILPI